MAKSLQQLVPVEMTLSSALMATSISLVTNDSREVTATAVYCDTCETTDLAAQYIQQALACGAVVVFSDKAELAMESERLVIVDDAAALFAQLAAAFYEHPSQQLNTIAVTGTNGKTTVAYLLSQLVALLNSTCAYSGTLGFAQFTPEQAQAELQTTGFTTPPAHRFQALLAAAVAANAEYCVCEVSSHALAQKRVDASRFGTAIFTNLSQDHLDYHGSMAAYGAAKARLFEFEGLQHAVINIDDAFGQQLCEQLVPRLRVLSISLQNPVADYYFTQVQLHSHGFSAQLVHNGQSYPLRANLVGEFNQLNILSCIAAAHAQGFDLSAIIAALPALSAPPGRMQVVNHEPTVVVDFAHSPDALAQVCANLSRQSQADLWVVFGCGGDRDASKRPLMAQAAAAYADQLVITSDNPRTESPQAIVADILKGLDTTDAVTVELDRAKAIHYALAHAAANDTVLIAGKGHEQYQLINGQRLAFSDQAQVQIALEALAAC